MAKLLVAHDYLFFGLFVPWHCVFDHGNGNRAFMLSEQLSKEVDKCQAVLKNPWQTPPAIERSPSVRSCVLAFVFGRGGRL